MKNFNRFIRNICRRILPRVTGQEQSLYQRLNVIFGFFFLIPTFGLLYFLITYDLLSDKYIPHFFVLFLICSLAGFVTLRMVFEKIANLSNGVTQTLKTEFESNGIRKGVDEVENISKSFTLFERQLNKTFSQLEKKVSEIAILKELSDLCYVTFDPEELLYVTLERGLKIANADIGSILILEDNPEKHFVVKASIGLGEHLNIGSSIDFKTSIAKYAIINKAPFVVEDIENDTRLGPLVNKSQYGSKSFVCMPIKTIRDIIGVMTLSRKTDTSIFTVEDMEGLIPLVSNAAFTYENLRLLNEIEGAVRTEDAMGHLINTVNSSMRDIELYQTLLKDILKIVPLQGAILMANDVSDGNTITVVDFFSKNKTEIQRGESYSCKDSILERLFIQGDSTIMENLEEELTSPVEKTLFLSHGGTSGLIHPLLNSGKLTGCFAFIFKDYKATLKHHELTRKISNLFSLAMEKTTLSLAARQRASELATIRQIGSVLASSTFDIEQVLSFTMDMIRVALKVEAGSLLLIEDKQLKVKTAFNVTLKQTTDFTVQLGQGIAGYVASKGDCLIENDVQSSSMFFSAIDDSTGFTTRSALCVPMISQGKVIGVIEVINKINGKFVADDQQLLQAIASSVSIAIENARLYKETLSIAEQERGIRQIFQKFVPKEIVSKIVHGGSNEQHLMEEFKTVTILNIDIRNFSKLSNSIGPQKTVFALNHFFSIMGEIIFSNHGIVDKYLGDGFLALFGAPLATISDADNAVFAAVEMKKALGDINTYLREKIGVTLNTGISIHTGEVVVGNIGFDKKMDYTVIGDAVNSAFGIQEMTKQIPDSILISEKTMKAMRYSVKVNEMATPPDTPKVEGLRVFELISLSRPEPIYTPDESPPA
ncbi:Adenylate cyclase, class 3 [Desulfocicer vacuolatum DSM 3385]|uniref:Adenylate cyclase, class 3 n=1 Tax=Desulfocicer vacuolatum DSM 3385 TaxID=1121400 RepID=A0A1W2D9V6_9BACT|nr:adenylate/guanylate cyclase domain-containing protein [Desulfocicer vacuolatum]SMC94280.1 Adenylate cyclase, class 3 [Desulfocicer vacuolatum DSM 3385]